MASVPRAARARRHYHPYPGKVSATRRRKLREIARDLPQTPGVYAFRGYRGRLLYVGKANCLRERVSYYFAPTKSRRSAKLRRLLAEIESIEHTACGSEFEALLLERRRIAEEAPLLNWQHKRFAVYPYLLLTREEFPRLLLTRTEAAPLADIEFDAEVFSTFEVELPLSEDEDWPTADAGHFHSPFETPPFAGDLPGLYFGPFTTPRLAQGVLSVIHDLLPLRTCAGALKPDPAGSGCIYGEMGRCSAPCIEKTTHPEYEAFCREVVALLGSGTSPREKELRTQMAAAADGWEFETAARLREQLRTIAAASSYLQRLERMRSENNVLIAQLAATGKRLGLFMVRGGVVRRHIEVDLARDAYSIEQAIEDTYATYLPDQSYTTKTELDEMLIIDRWLKQHGDEPCCVRMPRDARPGARPVLKRLNEWAATVAIS